MAPTIRQATDPKLIAVYGSLRAGCALPNQPDLAAGLKDLGRCILAGALYDLGDYPGLLPGRGRVIGELYELRDPGVLVVLDEYEEYDRRAPSQSEYVRRLARLIEPAVDAWVYYYNRGVDPRSRVASGDWTEYLRNRPGGRV